MIQIAILNESTVLPDADCQNIMAALQKQLDTDWASHWGMTAQLLWVPKGEQPPNGAWWLGFFDTSDQAGALGYHDLTDEGGPLGKVFAASDIQYHAQPSVTASHELLEIMADPDINLTCEIVDGQGSATLYAYESCDPVEADELGYTIDGVQVSDFVLPAYFIPSIKHGPWDFKGHLTGPVPSMTPGGYLSYKQETSSAGWQQKFADDAPGDTRFRYRALPRLGSRREKRSRAIEGLVPSDVASRGRSGPMSLLDKLTGHEPDPNVPGPGVGN